MGTVLKVLAGLVALFLFIWAEAVRHAPEVRARKAARRTLRQ